MKKTPILLGLAVLISVIVILLFWLNQRADEIALDSSSSKPPEQSETITLPIIARGDEIDPGPIEKECQRRMKNYMQRAEFEYHGFSECELIESKVGWKETHNANECPNGFSPQGCSICKIKCK